ncbi:MAG: bifunctional transaldolase/phosoglucose isomerase [Anaerolineales bacterium]|nr:bifunctional transaldolase/phosoglucose isomerase [Anaerolineales bacterium]
MTTILHELNNLGQSIWLDYIRRSLLVSGELDDLVAQGLRGVTSNPSIFEKAIAGSNDYDDDLRALVEAGKSVDEIYEALALEDIRRAADALRPVYDQSGGADGFVSLEVSPILAHDAQGTLAEARRLFAAVERPNLMIKIPATPAGTQAIQAAIAQGLNINATLIFSISQYQAVAEAYMAGLEQLAASGGDLSRPASVASFFVSRVDTAIDRQLQATGEPDLQGKIAIANAKAAYARFKQLFSGERWQKLAAQGARFQRPLWASTSAKNPAYPDTLYADNLIGLHTVNTLPPETLQAFRDHGRVSLSLESGLDEAYAQLARLAELGIDLEAVTQKLQDDGVAAFAKSFQALIDSIARKRQGLLAERRGFSASLGDYQPAVKQALAQMQADDIVARIWAYDHRVWKPEPDEIANRLGWLRSAESMQANLGRLQALAQAVRAEGYTHALLLGMGGSSLAPEVFRRTFGFQDGYLDLAVLDSTDPGAVLACAEALDPARTLFIVSTKSGTTVESLSFFKYFYNRTAAALGAQQAGAHFIAITDPGSKLVALAEKLGFREVFQNDPNIGGRYSALSYFGLAPAALLGLDLGLLLARARAAMGACQAPASANPGARLGVIMGELAKAGRDKLTLVASPAIQSFGDWVEQLIAESTGKDGVGILPVVGEPLAAPDLYGDDRLFVYLRLDGDATHDQAIDALEAAGHPVVRLRLGDLYDLGAQIFTWEMATAVAGYRLGIQPFDQPDVESAKLRARQMVAAYQEQGALPDPAPALQADGITVYGDVSGETLAETMQAFLGRAAPGAYLCLQAYVQPGDEMEASLLALRTQLRQRTRLAISAGYGPRFLHSTGQLHKGDGGRGLFIQITSDALQDIAIPDQAGSDASSIRFGVLKLAQALGDRQALLDAGRQVIRFHLGKQAPIGMMRLIRALE